MGYCRLLWKLFGLKRNEHKTRKQIQALQEKRLYKLLYYAYDHSGYYRRSFEQNGIAREKIGKLPLSAFPTMDKAILMERFDEIVTVPDISQEELRKFDETDFVNQKLFKGKYHVVHSSGSTGVPRYFVYDSSAWNSMLLGIIRGALWDMTMPQILKLLYGGLKILYIAATDGRYGGAMAVGDGIDGVGAKQWFLDIKTPVLWRDTYMSVCKRWKNSESQIPLLCQMLTHGRCRLMNRVCFVWGAIIRGKKYWVFIISVNRIKPHGLTKKMGSMWIWFPEKECRHGA